MPQRLSGETTWRRSLLAIPVTAPAAGAEWLLTVPAGHDYEPVSVIETFVTSAAVANRLPTIALTVDGVVVGRYPVDGVIAATSNIQFTFAQGATRGNSGGRRSAAIPQVKLHAGSAIGSFTEAIDVGDQYSGIVVLVYDTTVQGGQVDLSELPDLRVEVVGGPVGG